MNYFFKGFLIATLAVAIGSGGFYFTSNITKAAGTIEGSVDNIQGQTDSSCNNSAMVRGWVVDTTDSETPMYVFFTLSDTFNYNEILGQQTTYLSRYDVYEYYDENVSLKSGFGWEVNPTLYDGQTHTIYVFASHDEVVWSGSEVAYIGSITMDPINDGVQGSFDDIPARSDVVSGWAIDFDTYNVDNIRVPVMIYGDGFYMDTVIAENSRQDLLSAFSGCLYDSYHGFNAHIDIPQKLKDNRTHLIEAYAVDISGKGMTKIGQFHAWIYEDGTMELTDLY